MLVNWLLKDKLLFVAFADFCGVKIPTRFQANNSWTVSRTALILSPERYLLSSRFGVRHAAVCWLFFLYFPCSLPTLLQPTLPHRLVLTVGLLSSFGGSERQSWSPHFSLPGYAVWNCLPHCERLWLLSGGLCTQLSLSSSNCFFTFSLESGMPAAPCPHRLHYP